MNVKSGIQEFQQLAVSLAEKLAEVIQAFCSFYGTEVFSKES